MDKLQRDSFCNDLFVYSVQQISIRELKAICTQYSGINNESSWCEPSNTGMYRVHIQWSTSHFLCSNVISGDAVFSSNIQTSAIFLTGLARWNDVPVRPFANALGEEFALMGSVVYVSGASQQLLCCFPCGFLDYNVWLWLQSWRPVSLSRLPS